MAPESSTPLQILLQGTTICDLRSLRKIQPDYKFLQGTAVRLFPKDMLGHHWASMLLAFARCSEFYCEFDAAGRPSLQAILNCIPIERCREIDVTSIEGIPPDQIIDWLSEKSADARSLTISTFDASLEALIDRLVVRRHELRQIKLPLEGSSSPFVPYRDLKIRLTYPMVRNPYYVSVKNRHFGFFIDRAYTYDDSAPLDNKDRIVIKMVDRFCLMIIVVCGRPTTLTLDM